MRDIEQRMHTQNLREKTVKLTVIKQMTVLMKQHLFMMHLRLQINLKMIQCVWKPVKLQFSEIMMIERTEDNVSVLIKWVQHELHMIEEIDYKRLLNIHAFVALLSSENKSEEFCVLHCSAYFHDQNENWYRMIFKLSAASVIEKSLESVSLTVILTTNRTGQSQLTLSDKFKLTYTLTTSITEFHKIE